MERTVNALDTFVAHFLVASSLVLASGPCLAGTTRTIEFVATDFRTQQDNPTDYRSKGDPFGIFGLAQPAQITGSVVFDESGTPLFGPTTSNTDDPEHEISEVILPYITFTLTLGPGVVLSGAHVNLGDAMWVRDGVGTNVNDSLWFTSWTDQTLSGGISFDMQIQLVGEPSLFSGLRVPSPDVYNAMADSMPSYDPKLNIQMFDAQGNFHELFAFDVTFYETRTVQIDIKPGTDTNCFNANGHGVIPVAILGAGDFDAAQIDFSSLSFAGLQVRVRGDKGPLCSIGYANGDAYLDVICHFEDDSDSWQPGDGDATLTGVLNDGTRIRGSDSICIVP